MTRHDYNEIVLLEPQGDLWEGAECDVLEDALLELGRQGKKTIVDLSHTRVFSAHCLGVYAHAKRVALQNGGDVVLCNVSRVQRWLLQKTGLAEAITIHEDRASALHFMEHGSQAVA